MACDIHLLDLKSHRKVHIRSCRGRGVGGIELRIVENCKNLKTSFLKIVKLAKSKDIQ